MKKIFDLTTLLIVAGLAFLAYTGYHNFYLKKDGPEKNKAEEKSAITEDRTPKIAKIDPSLIGERGEDVFSPNKDSKPLTEADVSVTDEGIKIISGQDSEPKKIENSPAPEKTTPAGEGEPASSLPAAAENETDAKVPASVEIPPIEEDRTPKDPTIPEEKLIPEEIIEPETGPIISATPGFYENPTYKYNLTYPADWPIKIRREDNVSVGTIPPKNGQGAITVEVAADMDNEIEQAKEEAKRFPGLITIKEIPIIIGGTPGTKMTLYNSTNDLTDVYIYLKKNDYYYAIKYSEESAAFVSQVEKALSSFNFIN